MQSLAVVLDTIEDGAWAVGHQSQATHFTGIVSSTFLELGFQVFRRLGWHSFLYFSGAWLSGGLPAWLA